MIYRKYDAKEFDKVVHDVETEKQLEETRQSDNVQQLESQTRKRRLPYIRVVAARYSLSLSIVRNRYYDWLKQGRPTTYLYVDKRSTKTTSNIRHCLSVNMDKELEQIIMKRYNDHQLYTMAEMRSDARQLYEKETVARKSRHPTFNASRTWAKRWLRRHKMSYLLTNTRRTGRSTKNIKDTMDDFYYMVELLWIHQFSRIT